MRDDREGYSSATTHAPARSGGLSRAQVAVTQATPSPEERPDVRAYKESFRARELFLGGASKEEVRQQTISS